MTLAKTPNNGKEHWVTINGTHVLISETNLIISGPDNLVGRTYDPNKKQVERHSEKFSKRSEKELAEKYGGDKYLALNEKQRSLVRRRVADGHTLEEAYEFNNPKRKKARTLEELCAEYGQEYANLTKEERNYMRKQVSRQGKTPQEVYDRIYLKRQTNIDFRDVVKGDTKIKYGDNWENLSKKERQGVTNLTNKKLKSNERKRTGKEAMDRFVNGERDSKGHIINPTSVKNNTPLEQREKLDPKAKHKETIGLTKSERDSYYYYTQKKGFTPQEARQRVLQNAYEKVFDATVKTTSPTLHSEFTKGMSEQERKKYYNNFYRGKTQQEARDIALKPPKKGGKNK